jgi:uncharacterized membrane protein
MTGTAEESDYHIAKNRLETLIDGIFAIAMTLLVLMINVPKPSAALAPAVLPGLVADLVPQIFLFVIAFLVLAVFWLAHHRQFHFISTVDPTLLWITIFLLISIALVPFSTDLAGDYPDVGIAVLWFHVNIFLIGVLFCLHWSHICKASHLCARFPDDATVRLWYFQSALIPAVAVIAIIVAFVDPVASLLVYFLVPVPYYLLHRTRHAVTNT